MQLALFDLDNTLLPLDSDSEWLRFLVRLGVVDAELSERENSRFYRQYQDGSLDIFEWLAFQLGPLAQHSREQLDAWRVRFMAEVIEPVITRPARELVDKHQRSGDLCVLVTATNEFVTEPIAKAFGIEHLIATRIERDGDRFTGKPLGVPAFREGKIENTEQWLKQRNLNWSSFEQSWFYSDSANDLPLMSLVSNPVATNPDPKLSAHSKAHGWPIIQLFP